MKQKPEIGKAILFGLSSFIAYYICYFVLAFVSTLVFAVLAFVPVVNRIVDALFRMRGDSPSIFIVFMSVIFSYHAAKWVIERFCDYASTEKLSLRIAGVVLILYNVLLLVRNISSGVSFFPNILSSIAGIVLILSSNNLSQEEQ